MSITGVLLAFLASHQKKLQMESGLVARILSRLRSETTLDAALETTGHELLRGFGAVPWRLPCVQTRGNQAMLWTLNAGEEEIATFVSVSGGSGRLPRQGAQGIRAQAAQEPERHHRRPERKCRRGGDDADTGAGVPNSARHDSLVRGRLVRACVPLRSVPAHHHADGSGCSRG